MIRDTIGSPAEKALEYQIPGVRIVQFSQSFGPLNHSGQQLLLIFTARECRLRGESRLTTVKAGCLAAGNLQPYNRLEVVGQAVAETAGLLLCVTPEFVADFINRYNDVFDEKGRTNSTSCPAAALIGPLTPSLEAGVNSIALHFNYACENADLLMKLKVDALLVELLSEFIHYKKFFIMSSKATDGYLKSRLRSLLLDHAYSDIPICKIAEKGGYSPTAFKKLVKTQLGAPPRQWINKVRLDRSRQLLKDRRNSIAFVSHEVGFESQSYFSVIFKREFGMSPKDYQKMSK